MLQVKNVLFKFDEKTLFEDLSFVVHANHTVGLVGRNGVGKTTIFNLIRGVVEPEEGEVLLPNAWRISWLDQNVKPSDKTALDFVVDGHIALRKIEAKMRKAEARGDDMTLAHLHDEYEAAGGYIAQSQAGSILSGLGFGKEDFEKPHRTFSGGWRIRLNLARTLMTPADLMLLDEPTNHLDLEAIVWLQRWFEKFDGTLVCISHDREFLDHAVEEIVFIEHFRAFEYRGNYSTFERQRAHELELQAIQFERQEKERQRITRFVERFRTYASKAKQVQSRIKMLERMTEVAPLRAVSPYRIRISNPDHHDEPTIALDEVDLGYGETTVLSGVTERIYPRDRIGVLGLNGAGKSTLLKAVAGELQQSRGSIHYGEHCKVAYFAQHQLELLEEAESPRDYLKRNEELADQTIRNYLGGWGFAGDDVFRPISQFSGGEKARLVLAILVRTKPAVLVLDEPTNHLDIDMREALADALREYEGAVLLVAHDQHLLRTCCDEFWLVAHGRVARFGGDLDNYEETLYLEDVPSPATRRVSRKSLRRERAEIRRLQQKEKREIQSLEGDIHGMQSQIDELADKLSDPKQLESVSNLDVGNWIRLHGQLRKRLETLEERWLELARRQEESETSQPED